MHAPTATARFLFFGVPGLTVLEGDLVLPARKHWALLLLLVVEAQALPRGRVAELLWGAADPEAARANLRMAINRLPEVVKRQLHITRNDLRWRPQTDVGTDLDGLARALEGQDVDAILAWYRGELLADFNADEAPEFHDWLRQQRAHWQHRVRQRLESLCLARLAQRDLQAVVRQTRAWLQRDEACEAAHAVLIQALRAGGEHEAAQRQYDACAAVLAVREGRQPGPALRDEPAPVQRPQLRMAGRPVPVTPLVGRADTLLQLQGLLADPACRLLTLHGLGGVGKTRLAHALAESLAPRFEKFAGFVSCDLPGSWLEALARLAGAVPAQASDALGAFAKTVGDCAALVVLDNFETLLDGPAGEPTPALADRDASTLGADLSNVLELLRVVPGLRIVVTSRLCLGLMEEWVYPVEGLGLPERDARGAAADLFALRARQSLPGFDAEAWRDAIADLVRFVDGMPLAIELAAAWSDTYTPPELLDAWRHALSALSNRARNRPTRHRSLDAALQWAWAQLDARHRRALSQLALLPGGFDDEAAQEIARADPTLLQAWERRALIRRNGTRCSMHPLVRTFASEHAPQDEAAFDAIFGYYTRAVPARECDLAWQRAEFPNSLWCWQVALRRDAVDVLRALAWPLTYFCVATGLGETGRDLAAALVARLEGAGPEAANDRHRALHRMGSCMLMLQDTDGAAAAYERLFDIERTETVDPWLSAAAGTSYGFLLRDRGDLAGAIHYAGRGLAYAEQKGDPTLARRPHNLLASIYGMTAQWELADRHTQASCEAARWQTSITPLFASFVNRAEVLLALGRVDEAESVTQEILDACQRDANEAGIAHAEMTRARIAAQREDWLEAQAQAGRAVQRAAILQNQYVQAEGWCVLADVALASGRVAAAEEYAGRALAAAGSSGAHYTMAMALQRQGRAAIAGHDVTRGLALFRSGLSTGVPDLLAVKLPIVVEALLVLHERGDPRAADLLQRVCRLPQLSHSLAMRLRQAGWSPSPRADAAGDAVPVLMATATAIGAA